MGLAQAVAQEGFEVGRFGDIDAFEANPDALSSCGDHDFTEDDGGDATDTGITQEFLLNALVVAEVHTITKQDGVGVGSDRFGDEFLLKAVHHGEDDRQSRHSKRHAKDADQRDQRDKRGALA